MRAAVIDRYGPPEVAEVREVSRPQPRAGEVLVRVLAAPLNASDSRIRGGRFPAGFGVLARLAIGFRGPRGKRLAGPFSGVAEALGPEAGPVAPAVGNLVCGAAKGAHGEYVVAKADKVVRVPSGVSADDAAAVLFGGCTALHYLRDKGKVHAGQSVLVVGASGSVGTAAVSIAKYLGATVTAVTSTGNLGLVRELGADRVVDYTHTDVAAMSERYDVVFETVGSLSLAEGKQLLAPDGVLLLAVATLGENVRARGNAVAGVAHQRVPDVRLLLDLVANGTIKVVIDNVYPLSEIVAAHRRADSGHKRGNIVIHP